MNNNKVNIIGVGGLAKSGKDLFCTIAANLLKEKKITTIKFAFADELKDDIDSFLREKYGISAWTSDPDEKEIIRGLLVAHGCCKRNQTKGQHWIDKIQTNILNFGLSLPDVIFLSDIRFKNEVEFIHSFDGKFIHLSKYRLERQYTIKGKESIEKVFSLPPNEEEKLNDPIIKKMADFRLEWEDIKGSINIELHDVSMNEYLIRNVKDMLGKCNVF